MMIGLWNMNSLPTTPGGFGCILADPPWSFKTWSGKTGTPHRTDNDHYVTTATGALCDIPVADIAAKDCALFMWVVDSHISDAIELGRAWGFEIKTRAFTWRKLAANQAQAHIGTGPQPIWHQGDSRNITNIAPGEYDMVFSCPPYADLEVYSDDPADISTLSYAEFLPAYEGIIEATCALLKDDSFAVFVVGDVRDKKGNYYGFPWHTIAAFEKAGLHLYNEAVLVTAAGSLPIRTGKQFRSSRKFGKTHQNILVFVKGDGKRAAQACEAANDNNPAQATNVAA